MIAEDRLLPRNDLAYWNDEISIYFLGKIGKMCVC